MNDVAPEEVVTDMGSPGIAEQIVSLKLARHDNVSPVKLQAVSDRLTPLLKLYNGAAQVSFLFQ